MTHETAQRKLEQVQHLIFEVESKMDVTTSYVRIYGYRARIAVAEFRTALRRESKRGEDKIDSL